MRILTVYCNDKFKCKIEALTLQIQEKNYFVKKGNDKIFTFYYLLIIILLHFLYFLIYSIFSSLILNYMHYSLDKWSPTFTTS